MGIRNGRKGWSTHVKTKNYLILCATITVVLVVTLLYVPGVSDTVEQLMLAFLSTNAQ